MISFPEYIWTMKTNSAISKDPCISKLSMRVVLSLENPIQPPLKKSNVHPKIIRSIFYLHKSTFSSTSLTCTHISYKIYLDMDSFLAFLLDQTSAFGMDFIDLGTLGGPLIITLSLSLPSIILVAEAEGFIPTVRYLTPSRLTSRYGTQSFNVLISLLKICKTLYPVSMGSEVSVFILVHWYNGSSMVSNERGFSSPVLNRYVKVQPVGASLRSHDSDELSLLVARGELLASVGLLGWIKALKDMLCFNKAVGYNYDGNGNIIAMQRMFKSLAALQVFDGITERVLGKTADQVMLPRSPLKEDVLFTVLDFATLLCVGRADTNMIVVAFSFTKDFQWDIEQVFHGLFNRDIDKLGKCYIGIRGVLCRRKGGKFFLMDTCS